jgi:hypothetical protein
MAWSDEELRARVEARAAAIGKSVSQVLRDARLAPTYLVRPKQKAGRGIAKLEQLATALDWTLCEVLGCGIASDLLDLAITTALRGLDYERHRELMLPTIIADTYVLLAARRGAGASLNPSDLALIEETIKVASRRRSPRAR